MLVVVGILILIFVFAVFIHNSKNVHSKESIVYNGTKVDRPKASPITSGISKMNSGAVKTNEKGRGTAEAPKEAPQQSVTSKPINETSISQKKSTFVAPKPYKIEKVPFLEDVFNIEYSQRLTVKFDLMGSQKLEYPLLRAPHKGIWIKLPVHGRSGKRGACERKLCSIISKHKLEGFMDNLTMFAKKYPYEPDLAYIDEDKGIFIDVEVDEPYSGLEKIPIHYVIGNCSHTVDDKRNLCFTERGWIVLRFSEKQVFEQPESCLKYIYQIIHRIDSSVEIPSSIKSASELKVEKMWTKEEALIKIRNKDRENMLGISEFIMSNDVNSISVLSDYEGAKEVEDAVDIWHDEKEWSKCSNTRSWDKYIDNYPMGKHVSEAKAKIDDELWNECKEKKAYDCYLRTSKLQKHSVEAKQLKAIVEKIKADNARKEMERLQAIKEENERKKQAEELERKRREADEQKKREAEFYSRQNVSTNSSSPKTPSSRGYA